MAMDSVSKDLFLPPANQLNVKDKVNSSLDKDDFLKILITQLQNQDPTNPMQDREFIAQMAQFSSLEQTMNLSKAFEAFTANQSQSQLIEFSSFIGKTVTWHAAPDETSGAGEDAEQGEGKVESIRYKNGNVEIVLEDGKVLLPSNISEVSAS